MSNKVPHPDQVAAAVARVNKTNNITFDVNLKGAIRTVWLYSGTPMPNRVQPLLTVIFYKMEPVVATPYMPQIYGHLAVTNASLNTNLATWVGDGWERQVYFRPCNPDSEAWLRVQLARAAGMRFRRHGLVKPDQIIYTREP